MDTDQAHGEEPAQHVFFYVGCGASLQARPMLPCIIAHPAILFSYCVIFGSLFHVENQGKLSSAKSQWVWCLLESACARVYVHADLAAFRAFSGVVPFTKHVYERIFAAA